MSIFCESKGLVCLVDDSYLHQEALAHWNYYLSWVT